MISQILCHGVEYHWYNFIIQHNPTPSKARAGYDAKNGKGNAHINPNRDRGHGRRPTTTDLETFTQMMQAS